ncbi:MAG TPA: dihydrolipoamide acetyltransferase family protein [Candidatus Dormibacteraeota bacterium]
MAKVNMPKLSDTMEEGTVLEWKKDDGSEVHRGDVLADIESDKASFELEAEADGVLQIVVGQGEAVPVGQVIATIGEEAGAGATRPAPAPELAEAKPTRPAPAPAEVAATPAEVDGDSHGERVKASPLARRLAEQMGVDIGAVSGTGPGGRIVKEDVIAAADRAGDSRPAPSRAPRDAPPPRPPGPEFEVEEPTRMQALIARRMVESKTTVPHFYVTIESRMDEAMSVRDQLRRTVAGADKLTVTDMLVRASALALVKFPEVNSSWVDGRFERKRRVNIGIAVAREKGLIVPVVRDADRKDLVQISIESRQLVERARAGKATQDDLSGGSFSISNLGMYGVDEFQAIINPPEAGILAVGGVKDAVVVDDGEISVAKVMRMTLSVDHRVFYGATAAEFLAEVVRLMENPVSLVLPPEG